MVKRVAIPSKEIKLKVIGPVAAYEPARIQSFNINTDVPSDDVDELGNPLHVGQSYDIPNVTSSLEVLDTGIKTFAVLTGTDPDSYPGVGVDISLLSEIDMALYIRDPDVDEIVKSAEARRLQVRDFTFNYTLDGMSTESYNFVGSEFRWFKEDVVVDSFDSGTTSFTLSETPLQLKNGRKLLTVILDGEYLIEVDSGPVTGEYSVSGTTLTTFDSRTAQVLAVYQAAITDVWTDIGDTLMPVSIRGKDVDVIISALNIKRVQSVTINGNLTATPVRELGTHDNVGWQKQVPKVEGTITVLDTDTELIDLLLNASIASGDTEFQLGQGCTPSGVPLEIQLVDPCDIDGNQTVLKTIQVPDLALVGDGYQTSVNNNAAVTYNWRSNDAQCIVYSGAP